MRLVGMGFITFAILFISLYAVRVSRTTYESYAFDRIPCVEGEVITHIDSAISPRPGYGWEVNDCTVVCDPEIDMQQTTENGQTFVCYDAFVDGDAHWIMEVEHYALLDVPTCTPNPDPDYAERDDGVHTMHLHTFDIRSCRMSNETAEEFAKLYMSQAPTPVPESDTSGRTGGGGSSGSSDGVNGGRASSQKQSTSPPDDVYNESSCEAIEYYNNPERTYDLVFIPDGYRDISTFRTVVRRFVNEQFYVTNLNNQQYFDDTLGKINIWAITDMDINIKSEPLDEEYFGIGILRFMDWDHVRVVSAIEECLPVGSEYYYVMISRKYSRDEMTSSSGYVVPGFFNTRRGVLMQEYALNDGKPVLGHELGHMIAFLGEEYDLRQAYTEDSSLHPFPNCTTDSRCVDWKQRLGADGCFNPCGYSNLYKSTGMSVMHKVSEATNEFSLPAIEDGWKKALVNYE